MKIKLLISAFIFIMMVAMISCNKESSVVNLADYTYNPGGSPPGDNTPRLVAVFPENASTDVPVDTDIVLVFSEPVNLATIIPANVSITGVAAYTASAVTDGRTVIINITAPANLPYNTLHTIQVTNSVTDAGGTPLDMNYTSTFTTVVDNTTLTYPRVIAATRYPAAAATGVSINQPYVEVTFTKDMLLGSITIASFSIAPAVGASITQVNSKTYRLNINLNPLIHYNTAFTVDLTAAITDTSGYALVQDGNDTWNFTTETDPDIVGALAINSAWVDSVTSTSAWIYFVTNQPVDRNNCVVDFDTDGAPYASTSAVETNWDGGSDMHTLHKIELTPLTQSTLYYFRARETASGTVSTGYTFVTKTDTVVPVSNPLTNAANNQDGLKVAQNNDGSSYAFWESHDANDNIYGQFFNTVAVSQWGANGTAVCSEASNQTSIAKLSDITNDALVLYKTGATSVYGKMIYNNGGAIGFRWGGPAAGTGILLATILSGSNYSATHVYERPTIVTTGVADMPDNGTATNLLFDRDQNFNIGFLDVNDLLLTNTAGINWTSSAIDNQSASPYDIFPYILRSSALAPNLGAFANYYLADADVTITGIADSSTTTTELRSSITDLTGVVAGDIIYNSTDGEWGIALAPGAWNIGGWWYVTIDRALTLLNDTDNFTIYSNHIGPLTSEAVTNPLWDLVPSTLFNPGVTVLTGDIVINENNNSAPVAVSQVAAINLALDSNYALRLNTDIMNNGDDYAILRLPTGATYLTAGYNTDGGAFDFQLRDSNAGFIVAGVTSGDIVFNIDSNVSAMVVTRDSATQLTLSADIFNAANLKYVIYRKRAFMVTYVDGANDIIGNVYNIATGATIGGPYTIATGTFRNPVSISDEAGNAIVFYEDTTNFIHVRSISASGGTNWTNLSILNGYTIVQVLPTRTIDAIGGAFLLYRNTAGTTFGLLRINGVSGAIAWDTGALAGYDPRMIVDSITGLSNRVVITYRDTHTVGPNTYYHISAQARVGGTGALAWGPVNVTSNTAANNCIQPRISLGDNGTGASSIYISWFDGRYYSTSGYSIFAQQLNNAGTAQWASPAGVFISTPTSYGYDYPIGLELLYWDDGGAPFGLLPIWYDYRNATYDIYYEVVNDNGSY